jgi:hypothetical protein
MRLLLKGQRDSISDNAFIPQDNTTKKTVLDEPGAKKPLHTIIGGNRCRNGQWRCLCPMGSTLRRCPASGIGP